METSISSLNSAITEDKTARIRRKLYVEAQCIKNRDVDQRVIAGLSKVLRYFSMKTEMKESHRLIDLILMWMETIVDVKNRCITVDLKEIFDDIIHEITVWCGKIAIHAESAPFLRKFFCLWSKILSGTDTNIKRIIALHNIPSLIIVCETIFKTGHFVTQVNGLQVFLHYVGSCETDEKDKLLSAIIPAKEFQRARYLLYNFDNSKFEFHSREFLNEFNMKISEEEPVYSIAVEKGYIGEKLIKTPRKADGEYEFWVDFNSATESISFYCDSTTFFQKSRVHWINIEIFPYKINLERNKCEIHIFAARNDVDIEPLTPSKLLSQPELFFRFVYNENDLSHLQKVIACYNSKMETNKDTKTHEERDRFYTGFKTLVTEISHDNVGDNHSSSKWLKPQLAPLKIQPNNSKSSKNLASQKPNQNIPKTAIFEKIEIHTNKRPTVILAPTSDLSSAQITSIYNNRSNTEEIVSTSDASKISAQKTSNTDDMKSNLIHSVVAHTNITKDPTLSKEVNKKDETAKGWAKVPFVMVRREPLKEMSNVSSAKSNAKKSVKTQIETLVHDDKEMSNVTNGSQNIKNSGNAKIETVTHGNRELANVAGGSKTTNAKASGKTQTETVDNEIRKINRKTRGRKPGKAKIKTVANKITNDVNPVFEKHLSAENISQNKDSNQAREENNLDHPETVSNAEKEKYKEQNPKSASKRKLYTPTEEDFAGSQLSKDSQLQRRKYLQERRKSENRNSLKLVNLVKPLEFSEKHDDKVKEVEISNVTNTPIAGNEEQIQEVVEEYVNNKGYIGIKSSMKRIDIATKYTPQQQETIENNLKTLNTIFMTSANKFFKTESSTVQVRQLDVYDVRNCIAEDPVTAKKGRQGKRKSGAVIKKHIVPKYVGENFKVSHSYRRNLGNMKNYNTDFDKLKQAPDSNTIAKQTEKSVKTAAVIPTSQQTNKATNNSYDEAEGSVREIVPMEISVAADITAGVSELAAATETPKNKETILKKIQEEKNFQSQTHFDQSSNQSCTSEYEINNLPSTDPFMYKGTKNQSINQNSAKSSCNSLMENQSMYPNISPETKDCGDKTKQKEAEGRNLLNDSHPSQVKPGKYTSYEQSCSHPEKNLDCNSSNICYGNGINPAEAKELPVLATKSNWIINKFFDSFSNEILDGQRKSVSMPIISEQAQSDLNLQDCVDFNNFEDDNVDLDSYCSHESDDCIIVEEDNYLGDERNVEDTVELNVSRMEESLLQAGRKKEPLGKRKSPDPESKQVVLYKRVKNETTRDYNRRGVHDEMFSNLKKVIHQFFTSGISDINVNSNCDEVKDSLFQQLSTSMMSFERHHLQSFEGFKLMQKLHSQIINEKDRLKLETYAAFNQCCKMQRSLMELRNTYKTNEIKKQNHFEKLRIGLKETIARMGKSEWEAYINNVTNNIVENIRKHSDFDLQ